MLLTLDLILAKLMRPNYKALESIVIINGDHMHDLVCLCEDMKTFFMQLLFGIISFTEVLTINLNFLIVG